MKITFFSKTRAHKKFHYIPMYYDEQKEYLELKKAQYRDRDKTEQDIETRKDILRQEMSANWSRTQNAAAAKRTSNIRILILIGLIVALGYFILYGLDQVDVVINKLW